VKKKEIAIGELAPKGTLVPIGGGSGGKNIIKRIIEETGRRKPDICYITVATSSSKEAKQKHKKFAEELGRKNISSIYFHSHNEADTTENEEKIKNCHAVFIGGGDQLRLSSLLGGTALMKEIKKRY
jgi:cyanophycinase